MIKNLVRFILFAVLVLILIFLVNTLRFSSVQPDVQTLTPIAIQDSSVRHFQEGLKFRTISYDNAKPDSVEFTRFQAYLEKTYPLIFSKLERIRTDNFTLFFKWQGSDLQRAPVVMMAHQDVVPVEKEALAQWKVDPFGGMIRHGKIYGRGAADDKIGLFGILEATERLLSENYQRKQTIYFVFGPDEEAGGKGATAANNYFLQNNIRAEWVLDEGGEITLKEFPGLENTPVALIGTSEKGYVSLNLSVSIIGGHSSMPKKETAIDVLTSALQKLRVHPFKAEFSVSTQGTLNYLGPEMPFGQKLAIANRWFFKPVLLSMYEKTPGGNATVRTTMVPTIIQSGVKDNVVPTNAHAVVNFRTLPGTTIQDVVQHVRAAIDDNRVRIMKLGGIHSEASKVSADSSAGFKLIAQTVRSCFPGSIVAPFLTIGATDGRKLENMSNCVLRFLPVVDIQGMHGVNECVGVDEYRNIVNFYYQLLKKS